MSTAARRLAVLALFAALGGVLPFALSGCGGTDTCPTENPALAATNPVPTCTGARALQAGSLVSVTIRTCPTCNQSAPACTVIPPAADGIIQLDPLVQTCTSSGSCPPTCSLSGVTCTFTAPAAGSTYQLLVNDPAGLPVQVPFETVASGGQVSCSG